MKTRLPAALGWSLLAGAVAFAPARAQTDAKIAFINSERIFKDYAGFREAERAYQVELDGWMRELQNRERELTALQESFRAQEPMLSEEKRLEKEQEFQRVSQEYEQFRQSVFGDGGKSDKRNQELLEPVLATIQAAVEKVAKDDDYDIIFDAVDGNIIWAAPEYDITDRVLDELRAQSPESVTPGQSTTTPGQTPGGTGTNDPND